MVVELATISELIVVVLDVFVPKTTLLFAVNVPLSTVLGKFTVPVKVGDELDAFEFN